MRIPRSSVPDHLRILSWPFHNGLRAVGMGSSPVRLAGDDEFRRAGIEAEGRTITFQEIEAADKNDPEIARVIELIRRLAPASTRRRVRVHSRSCSPATATAPCARPPESAPRISAWSGSTPTRTSTTPGRPRRGSST